MKKKKIKYWSSWWKKANLEESEKVEITVKYLKFLNLSVYMNIDFNEASREDSIWHTNVIYEIWRPLGYDNV